MIVIRKYYELLHEIDISNFRVKMLSGYPDEKEELKTEQERNGKLQNDLGRIKSELSEKSVEADNIRMGFIYVLNGVLKSFAQIRKWGSYYPDLSQGMIIPGYLFGKILDDFKTALKSEGSYNPVPNIYMSQDEWDYDQLQSLLEAIHDELVKRTFYSKTEAIEYYEGIKKSILEIVEDFKKKRII